MRFDYIELGPTPCDENCVQVGEDNYRERAKRETTVFVDQLNREFSSWVEDGLIKFGIKWFSHDFGSYCEAVVYYNDDDEASRAIAIVVENNTPFKWDDKAIEELEIARQLSNEKYLESTNE